MCAPTLNTYTHTHTVGELTAMTLKKSSSPRVSRMEDTVCLAMVSLRPFMLPLTSTRMTTSFGEVAAWMYHFLLRQSKAMTPFSSGFHLIPLRNRICVTHQHSNFAELARLKCNEMLLRWNLFFILMRNMKLESPRWLRPWEEASQTWF